MPFLPLIMWYYVAKRRLDGIQILGSFNYIKKAREYAYAHIHEYYQLTIAIETEDSIYKPIGDVYLGDMETITYHGFGGLVRGVFLLNADGSLRPMDVKKE